MYAHLYAHDYFIYFWSYLHALKWYDVIHVLMVEWTFGNPINSYINIFSFTKVG